MAAAAGTGGRHKFVHEGRTVYEWQQSMQEIELFIAPPAGVKASQIACEILTDGMSLGLKGNPPFINEKFTGRVKPAESCWMIEDGELVVNLQKLTQGETWPSVFVGHGQLDEAAQTEVRKKMMLERFQDEHPGFDFSGAEFSGMVPDPKAFMGGVQYK